MDLLGCPLHPLLNFTAPVVFNGMINEWAAANWTPETLSETLGDLKLGFRVGAKFSSGVVWEADCMNTEATVKEYSQWANLHTVPTSNPLSDYDKESYWCYAGYTYMAQSFLNFPELLEGVNWSVFGFNGRKGAESTFWMGSEGAYTPCHFDTYGCNLVAQIYGRKRWILFPPTDTNNLYPTRLPYEESSVYSQVDIRNPDFKKHPKFFNCKPHIVTLEPGQVLFVPKQWWHLVECVENSISVNSWIEMAGDDERRFEEAVARAIVTSLIKLDPKSDDPSTWLNPNEEEPTLEECDMFLTQSWKCLKKSSSSQKQTESENRTSDLQKFHQNKRQKLDKNDAEEESIEDSNLATLKSELDKAGVPVGPCTIEDLFKIFNLSKENLTSEESIIQDLTPHFFLNCVSHPDVVALVCKLMKENANLNR